MLLVSQQGSLHRVADENAIDRLVEQVFTGQLDSETLKKKRQFKGNLKQLCGFIQHGHNSKSLVNGYQIFDRMRWICMDGAKELVPILGTPKRKRGIQDGTQPDRCQFIVGRPEAVTPEQVRYTEKETGRKPSVYLAACIAAADRGFPKHS